MVTLVVVVFHEAPDLLLRILVRRIPAFFPQAEIITRRMAADIRLLDVCAAWCMEWLKHGRDYQCSTQGVSNTCTVT